MAQGRGKKATMWGSCQLGPGDVHEIDQGRGAGVIAEAQLERTMKDRGGVREFLVFNGSATAICHGPSGPSAIALRGEKLCAIPDSFFNAPQRIPTTLDFF
jgi:hypothetical protein